jgi:chromosomal replication initiator protein
MLNFWQDCSRLLERELTPQQFAAWIKPLKAIKFDDQTGDLRLGAPNRLKLDAVRAQFSTRIQAAVISVLHRPVNVVFEVEDGIREGPSARDAPAAEASEPTATVSAACLQNQERARLNPLL